MYSEEDKVIDDDKRGEAISLPSCRITLAFGFIAAGGLRRQ